MSTPTKLPELARLHERSVQAVAQGDVSLPREQRGRGRQVNSSVRVSRPLDELHPALRRWLKQHDVDLRRVQIVSPTELLILNQPAPVALSRAA